MPTYKLTRIYVVTASSKAEATEKVKANPTEYLEYESIKENIPGATGWGGALKKQLTGK